MLGTVSVPVHLSAAPTGSGLPLVVVKFSWGSTCVVPVAVSVRSRPGCPAWDRALGLAASRPKTDERMRDIRGKIKLLEGAAPQR